MKHRTKARWAFVAVLGVAVACVCTTSGDGANTQVARSVSAVYGGAELPVGTTLAADVVGVIVQWAPQLAGGAGQALLPTGTTVDRVEWVGNIVEIDLAVPAIPSGWFLGDTDLETLSQALASPFLHDDGFGGTRIRVRVGSSGSYGTLDELTLNRPAAAPAQPEMAPEVPIPIELSPQPAEPGTRGAYGNAMRQPTGALTGVVVYAAAGHGWTAGDTAWFLQRPLLWSMIEDYGNIDQLNYFVNFAFNAGATVVPFRPVGWQPIEIVMDISDPNVTYTGSWTDGTGTKYYGAGYKWTSASTTETATARFTPTITTTSFYPVFCFTPPGTNRVLQTYRVAHNGGISEVAVDHRLVGNGWVWLGNYYLVAGENNYVEITNLATETGVIVADAIRWGDGVGDIVRPGPGTVSGYQRDEECARYWAESELGNHATGFDSNIWHVSGQSDQDDNVRTAAKWAREANQEPAGGVLVDRYKRIYLEFHSNASSGAARGQTCLVTDLGATTYQVQYATALSNEVDADMAIAGSEFEYAWYDRVSVYGTGSYGAICTPANGDEFDATIIEVAFHDNETDTKLLRDDRVRAALGRASVHGIIKFLHSLSGSTVPLNFAPDTPRDFRVIDAGSGNVTLSWVAPLVDGARGDAATGYVVYQSSNGYGFGNPIILGNVLTTTISGVPVGETRYFRIAATNAGGESMPSEVLAVRRPDTGTANILIVNGFDRLRRQINPTTTFTQPPAYAGLTIERQKWRESNAFDYIVEHAEALAASGYGFASTTNDAVVTGTVVLTSYDAVLWILGTESTEDATFSSTEQTKVTTFLQGGGGLFVSGSEIAYDLINQSHGVSFAQNMLRIDYVTDDAGVYGVDSVGGIFTGLGSLDFDPASGAPYDVRTPDVLSARTGALGVMIYSGGSNVAAVQFQGPVYNTVVLGFPFEAITSAAVRTSLMQQVIPFLLSSHGPVQFDSDYDGDVDMTDFAKVAFCFGGPGKLYAVGHSCLVEDGNADRDVDLDDFSMFQVAYTGSLP